MLQRQQVVGQHQGRPQRDLDLGDRRATGQDDLGDAVCPQQFHRH